MQLRIELFVADVAAARDFYSRVLGFEVRQEEPGGYTLLAQGTAQVALNPRSVLRESAPIRPVDDERPGRSMEIALNVEDIHALYERVQESGWEVKRPLKRQPWGVTDFGLEDPDGFFIRITQGQE